MRKPRDGVLLQSGCYVLPRDRRLARRAVQPALDLAGVAAQPGCHSPEGAWVCALCPAVSSVPGCRSSAAVVPVFPLRGYTLRRSWRCCCSPVVAASYVQGVMALATVVALLLYRNQNAMLYHPEIPQIGRDPAGNPRGYRDPSEWNMPYEDVYLETGDKVKLHCWFMKQDGSKNAPTLIFFQENAGNM